MTQEDLRFLELLERWTKGDATRSDEQELLSLSQNDDFRKNALEGFQEHPEAPHDQYLAVLQQRLAAIHPRKPRVFPLQWWLSLAAVGLVLLVALLFFQQKSTFQVPLATKLPDMQTNPVPHDSQFIIQQTQQTTDKAILKSTLPAENGPLAVAAPAHDTPAPAKPLLEKSQNTDNQSIAGRVEPAAAPLAYEVPAAANKPDSVSDKMVAASKTPPNSTVFTDDFKAYLKKSARLTDAARNQNVSGNVTLRFTINAQGRAEQIEITRSLGFGCDELALALIQNWTFASGTQGAFVTYAIPFVR